LVKTKCFDASDLIEGPLELGAANVADKWRNSSRIRGLVLRQAQLSKSIGILSKFLSMNRRESYLIGAA
jgi:hypothetical protein